MRTSTILVTLFSLASSVSAGGYGGLSIKGSFNFGCGKAIKEKATHEQKDRCSSPGSFFSDFKGSPICCSDKTWKPPSKGNTCPFGWGEHSHTGCCIPPKEVSPCDCGEGYHFDKSAKKCVKNTGGKCHGGQWWHDRSDTCCDNGWEHNPPKGDCPPGIKCPTGWYWHKGYKKCLPNSPHSPEPDCDDWDNGSHCCGGHHAPSPVPKPGQGGQWGNSHQGGKFPWGSKFDQADFEKWFSKLSKGGGGGGGGWGNWGHKRNLEEGQLAISFPQTDLDKMYCPGSLHACTVPTLTGGEWAYECVDFTTELESCGGCASTGEGVDCTKIPHADVVGCDLGVYQVQTCKSGFVANGTACVVA